MESGRPILAAVGLFFGGLLVGSIPGGGPTPSTAHAATSDPRDVASAAGGGGAGAGAGKERSRGPVAPALRRLLAEGSRDARADVEPPRWSVSAGQRSNGAGGGRRGRTAEIGRDDASDPLAGLKMPGFPVARTPQVLKYVRYFSESPEGRKTFTEGLRRSGRYSEVITRSLRELGLPPELVAVAFVESGFSTEALSTAGAAGLWQFMPGTARAYGLTIESTIDERASIWRSTDAAAHHLADLYERFRSWELALAAYNLGYDGLERRLDDFETDDFWTLADAPGGLPKETAHYVPKVLAAAVVFANLEELGFGDTERTPAVDAAELEVPGGTKLAIVARAAGTSLKVVRELNPELLADVVPDRGMPGIVHVPRGGLARAHSMLPRLADDVEAARVSDDFDWGKDEMRSGRSRLERTSAIVREPRAPRRSRRHVATESRPGARRAELDATEKDVSSTDRVAERAEPLAKAEPTAKAAPTAPTAPTTESTGKSETRVVYRVMAGDSLEQIGQAAGLTVDQVLAQAHITSAAQLQVGTLLELRGPARK